LLPIRAFWDLGGAGATADALSIWIVQWVGREIHVLDYVEGQGQVLAYYVNELRSRGYDKALCVLPHDGVASNAITGKRYRDHLADAGFETHVIPNQGKGAAMMRIEAVRRIFPQVWFNAASTEPGLDALGYYHERRDDARGAGLGPTHDWSSHAADAFGLMACSYEVPEVRGAEEKPRRPWRPAGGADGWLAG
jgi:phage terminase large subunit